jgi:CelD/BcsL family acetyltransferase involved in cellulose biosynthesis
MKSDFRRRLNKLNKTFNWKYEIFPDDCKMTVDEAMKRMMDLHGERWKYSGEYGVFRREKFRNYHLELGQRFCHQGWLKICFIKIDQKYVAALYGYQYGNKFYFYQMGYDPQEQALGLGKLLLLFSIKYAVESKLTEFDFLRGDSAYKFGLTKSQKENISIYVSRGTLKGMIAYYFHIYKPILKSWIKTMIPKKVWKYLSVAKYKRIMGG